jgi:hypothetical protein
MRLEPSSVDDGQCAGLGFVMRAGEWPGHDGNPPSDTDRPMFGKVFGLSGEKLVDGEEFGVCAL